MSVRAAGAARTALVWEASLVASLFALAALAWVVTGRLATEDMRVGLLTGASSLPWAAEAGLPSVGAMVLFLVTWAVMMAAMMFPTVAPVVVTVHRWVVRTGRSPSVTALFVVGYLLAWAASGMAVYAAIVALGPLLPVGSGAAYTSAAVLVAAGAYQFSPLKEVCLRQCRSPLAFVAEHTTELRQGGLAGTKVGAVHGVFCLGCCWALMIVLVLLGMMSLAWMAAVTGVILLEKVLPGGRAVRTLVGVVLVGCGAALLVFPQTLPALA